MSGFNTINEEYPSCFTQNPFEYILTKIGNKERIIEVENFNDMWIKRRLITIMPNGSALCYSTNTNSSLDSVEKSDDTTLWTRQEWREVQTIPTFTKEQICNALGVDNFEIKE